MNTKILIILYYITHSGTVSTGEIEIRDLSDSKCNQIKVALVNDLKRIQDRGVTTIVSANCY
jgi:hypothetical protein